MYSNLRLSSKLLSDFTTGDLRRGFTLVELFIVWGIAWILLGIAGPNLSYSDVHENGRSCFDDRKSVAEAIGNQRDGKDYVATFSDTDLRKDGALVTRGILQHPIVSHTRNIVRIVPECVYEALPIASDPDSLPPGVGREYAVGFEDCETFNASSEMRSLLEFKLGSEPRLINCIVHGPYRVPASSSRLITRVGVGHYIFLFFFYGPILITGIFLLLVGIALLWRFSTFILSFAGGSKAKEQSHKKKDWTARGPS
ncbi:MAG: hypothetical protein HQM09_15465 [Candidatus Riflebacteria bacterium]|nr:hypothetical protein [Candidatus Riflebacteria bacterium]